MTARRVVALLLGEGTGRPLRPRRDADGTGRCKLYRTDDVPFFVVSVLCLCPGPCVEGDVRNYDLALQHFPMTAKLGIEHSLSDMFVKGLATKADFAVALHGYQSSVEEMRSPDCDASRYQSSVEEMRSPDCDAAKELG